MTNLVNFKCSSPISLQFELTYICNNYCIFCYNDSFDINQVTMDTTTVKKVIDDAHQAGVMSLNFNGGEPLMRRDFFEIAKYAKNKGFDIHLNTNANLIDEKRAKEIAKLFPSICTTILSHDQNVHDYLSGRNGAFSDALKGIHNLQQENVYVAVNVVVNKVNIDDIYNTFIFLQEHSIKTLLLTRYIPCGELCDSLNISDSQFIGVLRVLNKFQEKNVYFDRIALPQPFKLCKLESDLKEIVMQWNIPCNIGICVATINPDGKLTPCNLVKEPVLGDLKEKTLKEIWASFDLNNMCENYHLNEQCLGCDLISKCGGGCLGYLNSLKKI